MSRIIAIETANPPHRHTQGAVADFYRAGLNGNDPDGAIARKIGVLAGRSGIAQRYSVVNDFSDRRESALFKPGHQEAEIPGLTERMNLFRPLALELSLASVGKIRGFNEIKRRVTHLITVTCTGLFAPGLEIDLVKSLGLDTRIARHSVNFMGCNAALIALRQAAHITAADPGAIVLLVCTELCSIHFQRDYTENYLLSNLLFGDGSAALLVAGEQADAGTDDPGLRLVSFHSRIIHDGYGEMGWTVSEKGFIMALSDKVTEKIAAGFADLIREEGINVADIRHWAIHPGGKRILDAFAGRIVPGNALRHSYEVLNEFGNMSSATVLYVLKRLLSSGDAKPGDRTLAAAFGPGLTIESAIIGHV